MGRLALRVVFSAIFGFALLGGPRAHDDPTKGLHPTGLVPLTAGQVGEIVSTWPRITRVGLNRLGFERINRVRAEKGQQPLDSRSVSTIGDEVESTVAAPSIFVRNATVNEILAADLPVAVDNSLLKHFPPVRSQGSLGSCASFATTYYQFSYMTAFQRNLDISGPADETNRYSPKWTYNMAHVGGAGGGGSQFHTNYRILERHGAAAWSDLPYDGVDYLSWCLDPSIWRSALGVRAKAHQYLASVSTDVGLELVKELLTNGYILVFGTFIYSWVFMTIRDDVSTSDDDAAVGKSVACWINGSDGVHAMTIVGYNDAIWTDINGNGLVDAGEKGALRIANSWGTEWLDNGLTWLAYDALRKTSAVPSVLPSVHRRGAILDDWVYVLTARDGYAPKMIGEFTVNHAKRKQLKLTVGTSAISTQVPSTIWFPGALQHQGGDCGFDGSSTAPDGTFVMDFSDILTPGAASQRYFLGLEDWPDAGIGTLIAFKIVDLTTDPDTEIASSLVPQTADGGQIYAYVDYEYRGPAANEPPELSRPWDTKWDGGPEGPCTFEVVYSDPNGDPPSIRTVVVDGVPHEMVLYRNAPPADGFYEGRPVLAAGEHSHFFYFEDGRGGSARVPLTGVFFGPTIRPPVLTSLSPYGAGLNDAALALVIDGKDITMGSVVTWDGADRPTTYVSPARLQAQIFASDLRLGKFVPVIVRSQMGTLSNALTFAINNPVPSVETVIPASATGGGTGLALTLRGSNFAPNATARWNGAERATAYVGPTEVRASLTAQDLATAGRAGLSVVNPLPAGGESGAVAFDVSGFALAAPNPAASVTAGRSASYILHVTPQNGSYDSTVTFTCTGLPRGVRAGFSPATLIPGPSAATTTMTLSTTSRSNGTAASTNFASSAGQWPSVVLGLALLSVAFSIRLVSSRRTLYRSAIAGLLLVLIEFIGCSAGGGGGPKDTGTPAGTYEITVRGTSGGMTASTSVTLTVR